MVRGPVRAWQASGGRGAAILAVSLFLALAAFLYALSWNAAYVGFLSDDAIYLLMADGFSPYRPAESELIAYVMRQSQFPPMYPLLLAVFGGGSASLLASHWLTTTTLVLSLVIFGFWTQFETKTRWLAFWLVLILGLLPGVLIHDLELFSEFPYMLLSLLALWLAARGAGTAQEYAAIALCVGLAAITRAAGGALIAAFGVWLYLSRGGWRVRWTALALALAPSVVWSVYRSHAVGKSASYDTIWLQLLDTLLNDGPGGFLRYLAAQFAALWRGGLTNLDLRPSLLTQIVLACTLLAAAPVWWRRFRSGYLDAWYLAASGAMLLLWPFPEVFDRLPLPLIPIVLLYSCLGVLDAGKNTNAFRGKPVLVGAFLAVLSLTLFPSVGFIVHRFGERLEDSQLNAWKHTRYWFRLQSLDRIRMDLAFRQNLIDAAREVTLLVPEDECIYGVHTAFAMFYSRRIFQQPPAPGAWTPQLPNACRYFFLMSTEGRIGDTRVEAYYPRDHLPADSTQIVHVWQNTFDPGSATAVLLRANPIP